MVGNKVMSREFIKQINEYVIESLLDTSDDEILSMVDSPGYPTSEEIAVAAQLIQHSLKEEKRRRLEQKKAEFAAHKLHQVSAFEALLRRSVGTMISDIVTAIQKTDAIPEGILLAFREQQENASDDDIARIWQSLVELGLIEPYDDDQAP